MRIAGRAVGSLSIAVAVLLPLPASGQESLPSSAVAGVVLQILRPNRPAVETAAGPAVRLRLVF
jgi:hypothetical protein